MPFSARAYLRIRQVWECWRCTCPSLCRLLLRVQQPWFLHRHHHHNIIIIIVVVVVFIVAFVKSDAILGSLHPFNNTTTQSSSSYLFKRTAKPTWPRLSVSEHLLFSPLQERRQLREAVSNLHPSPRQPSALATGPKPGRKMTLVFCHWPFYGTGNIPSITRRPVLITTLKRLVCSAGTVSEGNVLGFLSLL